MSQDIFFETARERYRMMLRKNIAAEADTILQDTILDRRWSDDPIFQEFRFCNVFREDDKVTKWFREHVRNPLGARRADQVRAAVVFRWFNNIATGEQLETFFLLENWRHEEARGLVQLMADRGERILNPAYMIKSPPGMNKTTGLFQCIANVLDDLEMITTEMMEGSSLQKAHTLLQRYPYLGPFMAYQMICDLRFTGVLGHATDINTWTAPGPGSARGVGRMFFSDVARYNYNSERDQELLCDKMRYLLECSREATFWPTEWPKWELSTVQHWCCEYDKYMRVLLGEGTPKQRYRPA
jgi:hypothetical protein